MPFKPTGEKELLLEMMRDLKEVKRMSIWLADELQNLFQYSPPYDEIFCEGYAEELCSAATTIQQSGEDLLEKYMELNSKYCLW